MRSRKATPYEEKKTYIEIGFSAGGKKKENFPAVQLSVAKIKDGDGFQPLLSSPSKRDFMCETQYIYMCVCGQTLEAGGMRETCTRRRTPFHVTHYVPNIITAVV